MPSYLVESYLARCRATAMDDPTTIVRRVVAAAEDLSGKGVPVRVEQSVTVPVDELCLVVVDAPSAAAALLVARTAGLEPVRCVEALTAEAAPVTTDAALAATGQQSRGGPPPPRTISQGRT